jgi:ferritin-like metal-binding protein YciE
MKLQTLKDLYIHELKALYSAEKQILEALPKMVQATTSAELSAAFQAHLEQTKEHANRLEKLLERHNQSMRGPRDKGMEGVLADGRELLKGESDHEMAGYGCARTYAEMLGDTDGARILQTTLSEEAETDETLTEVSKSVIKGIFS